MKAKSALGATAELRGANAQSRRSVSDARNRPAKTGDAHIAVIDSTGPDLGVSADAGKKSMVASTVSVLRLLAKRDRPVGVNAIARELGAAPSSCFKILRSLCAEDCVDFDEATKGYSIGVGAIMLARSALDPTSAFTTVQTHLEHVAEEAAVAIGMWRVVPGDRIALIGFVEGSGDLRVHLRIGQRLPMFLGALGRSISANMNLSTSELRARYERLRWEVPPGFEEYHRQVAEARAVGYAVDQGNFSPGVTTIGSVIRDSSGTARYGLSAITLARPSAPLRIEHIGKIVRDAAHWAEGRLFASFSEQTAA